jgi:hypothetical protein
MRRDCKFSALYRKLKIIIEDAMNYFVRLLSALFIFFCQSVVSSDEPETSSDPDFYSMPGINASRAYDANENILIDTFGGTLSAHYTDLSVPGIGPDINITRSFNSAEDIFNRENLGHEIIGKRWSLHFGKLSGTDYGYQCFRGQPSLTYNTVFQTPDGSSQIILHNPFVYIDNNKNGRFDLNVDYRPKFITASLWRVTCENNLLKITDTKGLSYYIGGYEYDWQVIKIVDKYGNSVDVNYSGSAYDLNLRIESISSSDGRLVTFDYSEENTLSSITNGESVIKYEVTGTDEDMRLISVTRPDGGKTEYEYIEQVGKKGYLKKIKSPTGVVTTFDYADLNFRNKDCSGLIAPDTLIRDNSSQTLRCQYEQETTV